MTESTKEKGSFTSAVEVVSNTNLTPEQQFQLLMNAINSDCFKSEPTSIHLEEITGDAYVFNNKGNVDLNLGGGSSWRSKGRKTKAELTEYKVEGKQFWFSDPWAEAFKAARDANLMWYIDKSVVGVTVVQAHKGDRWGGKGTNLAWLLKGTETLPDGFKMVPVKNLMAAQGPEGVYIGIAPAVYDQAVKLKLIKESGESAAPSPGDGGSNSTQPSAPEPTEGDSPFDDLFSGPPPRAP